MARSTAPTAVRPETIPPPRPRTAAPSTRAQAPSANADSDAAVDSPCSPRPAAPPAIADRTANAGRMTAAAAGETEGVSSGAERIQVVPKDRLPVSAGRRPRPSTATPLPVSEAAAQRPAQR